MNTGSGSYDLQAETKEYSKILGLSSGSNFCGWQGKWGEFALFFSKKGF